MGRGKRAGGFHRERSSAELSMAPYREDGQCFGDFGQVQETFLVDEHDRENRRWIPQTAFFLHY